MLLGWLCANDMMRWTRTDGDDAKSVEPGVSLVGSLAAVRDIAARAAVVDNVYTRQPPHTIMPIPTNATIAPARSQLVTGARSTFHSQSIATATYTPPYAA